ncbi:MAG: tetratricopeptide repeat protein, partial [Candidatus Hydrothermarchaeales archaeon]
MAVCPECGEQVPDGADFCLSCGSVIKAQEAGTPDEVPGEAPQEATKSAEAWLEEGNAHYTSKKFADAVASFEEALKLEPKNSKAWFTKALSIKDWGIALDDQEKVKSSLEAFDKSLEIDPKNGEIWYQKGMVQGLLEESENAIESFETALKLDPSNANYEMMYNAAKQQAKEKKAAPPPAVEEVEVAERPVEEKRAPVKAIDMKIPFPKNYTALISGPPGVGKFEYCLSLVKDYLKKGENVVYITTERSPQEIKDKLREDGFDADAYEGSQFLFIDIYSYSSGTKYDKGLNVDNPANLNLINIHLATAAQTIGKPVRVFFDSLSTLFLHAPVGEIKKFVGVLSSRAKTEFGFVLYTMQEGQHDEQTAMALRAMSDAVLETEFEEGPPLKRKFRVHHAKGMKTTPT